MEIKKEFPHINFLEKEPMSRHTTFRIGGPAGLFASVQVADEIGRASCRERV